MKRLFKWVIIGCLLFFAYQGWQKTLNEDSAQEAGILPDRWKQTINDTLDKAIGGIQSSLSGINQAENTDATGPVSSDMKADEADLIINELAYHIEQREPVFTLKINGNREYISEQISDWIDRALQLNDYAKYALASYSYTLLSYTQYTEATVKLNFRETLEQTEYVRSFVNQLFKEHRIAELPRAEQIKWIHDWIVSHVQYDESLTRYTAYEALTEQLAVCQGYALLGQMMYEEAGFEVKIAEGVVDSGDHAWNMVKLDDQWYHIDLTWDDPIGQASDAVSYRYYLVSDATLAKDHEWTRQYPTANLDYSDVLKANIELAQDTSDKAALEQLRMDLQMHWDDAQYSIESKQQLATKIKEMTQRKEQELAFRYADGANLLSDLQDAFKQANVSVSYEVSYSEWNEQGDVLVKLEVKYGLGVSFKAYKIEKWN